MSNKEIAALFKLCGSILELHGENPFKIKAYQSAAFNVERVSETIIDFNEEQLQAIEGITKNTASKIISMKETGTFDELSTLLSTTPHGVIEMLEIPGIGPKKVRTIWKELHIENKKDLLKACQADEIANLKGFGKKTQDTIIQGLLFAKDNEGKYLYAEVASYANTLLEIIKKTLPSTQLALTGQVVRKMEIIDQVQLVAQTDNVTALFSQLNQLHFLKQDVPNSAPFIWRGKDTELNLDIELKVYFTDFEKQVFLHSSGVNHLKALVHGKTILKHAKESLFSESQTFYQTIGFHNIVPEAREGFTELSWTTDKPTPSLITNNDLKGVLHNHSTYSDGKNTILEMAQACMERGYEYFGISDHSVTASYAGGLDEDRVIQQQREVDEINKQWDNFTVFKGIESDILTDGQLDYSTEVLKSFDFIVSSIHSNLKMDIDTATQRLINAIENPYTTFLGHMTGRLLLKRDGYPLDFKRVIDACADNKVIIEINANPRRLDIDWRWIYYALEKEVLISINPDAHQIDGIDDMQYGVHMARKAGVPTEMIFNSWHKEKVADYFMNKKG